MNLNSERVEDVRAAGLLHDIGKLDISRELLYKAARFTEEEVQEMQRPRGHAASRRSRWWADRCAA